MPSQIIVVVFNQMTNFGLHFTKHLTKLIEISNMKRKISQTDEGIGKEVFGGKYTYSSN
jgi:hypothetical protein